MKINAANANPRPKHHPVPFPRLTANATRGPICQNQHVFFATTTSISTTRPPTKPYGNALTAQLELRASVTLLGRVYYLNSGGQDVTTRNLHLSAVLFQRLVWVGKTPP